MVVVDVFGVNPIHYRPFLLKHSSQLLKAHKVFLYHSYLQDEEVAAQLENFSGAESWVPLQLWPQHPYEGS